MPFIAGKVGHRFGTLGRFSQSLSLKPLQKTRAKLSGVRITDPNSMVYMHMHVFK